MVKSVDISTRDIRVASEDFNINSLYKKIKEKSDELNYLFIEKEQGAEPKKYGNELIFKFELTKLVDDFVMYVITIDITFQNLVKIKGKDHGDARLLLKAAETLDYKNRFGMSVFNRLILKVYLKIKEDEFETKYDKPLAIDAGRFYDIIKEELGCS